LASIFAADICAYAIMFSHFQAVFHIDREKAENWSQSDVINQWHQLFSGTFKGYFYLTSLPCAKDP